MLLLFVVFIPFVGGLVAFVSEWYSKNFPKWIALITVIINFIITCQIWYQYYYLLLYVKQFHYWNLEFLVPWIKTFGIDVHLGIDGISLIMLFLTNFIGIVAILSSWGRDYTLNQGYQGFFYFNLMILLSCIIGIFVSLDLFLFFIFWELIIVPIYFLILFFGDQSFKIKYRIRAINKFFIYSQISSLIMLFSILGLVISYYNLYGVFTFNYNLLCNFPMDIHIEYILMLGFFLAFIIKMPIPPFHGWLSDIHACSPVLGAVDLIGILLKTAPYALLRFNIVLFPNSSYNFMYFIMLLGLFSIFYGAWMAFSQTDLKRIMAYSSISHMGLILIGIYSCSQLSYQGVLIQIVSYCLSSASLFILIDQLYIRTHTRDLRKLGGLWSEIRWLPGLFLFFSVANIGIPGTANFIGEFMILLGSFSVEPIVVFIASFSLLFSSIYFLNMINRLFYGISNNKNCIYFNIPLKKFLKRECSLVMLMALLIIFIGVYPQIILNISYVSIKTMQNIVPVIFK